MSEQTPKSIISELAAAAGLQTLEKYAEVDNKKQRLFIGIPREIAFQENRVPLTPDSVETLVAQGHRIVIESKAGDGARFSDKDYSEALNGTDSSIFSDPYLYVRFIVVLRIGERLALFYSKLFPNIKN